MNIQNNLLIHKKNTVFLILMKKNFLNDQKRVIKPIMKMLKVLRSLQELVALNQKAPKLKQKFFVVLKGKRMKIFIDTQNKRHTLLKLKRKKVENLRNK